MARIDAADIRKQAETITRAPAAAKPSMAARLKPKVIALAGQLNTQHEWLFANKDHPRFSEFEDQWLTDLRHYEAACDVLAGIPEQKAMVA